MEIYKLKAKNLMSTIAVHDYCLKNEIKLIVNRIERVESNEAVEMEFKTDLEPPEIIDIIKASESSGYNLTLLRQTIKAIKDYTGKPDLGIQ